MLMSDAEEADFTKWVVDVLGTKVAKDLADGGSLEDVKERVIQAYNLHWELSTDGRRGEAAAKLLQGLVPTYIDLEIWQALALGKNVHLPTSAQYGPVAKRVQPSHPLAKQRPRGNAHGKVHDKMDAPAQFLERQAEAVIKQQAEVARIEAELEAARARGSELEAGLQTYALTALFTQLRKAVAPIFAVGPAWTILRAIGGERVTCVPENQRERETQRILVVLHAMREQEHFERELKEAVLNVCNRYTLEASMRGKSDTEFDGPYDYESVLQKLAWPGD